MISKFFIERPIFATVTALILLLAGGVTLYTLPIAQFPDITPPTVQVTAFYPGASAETVAKTVGATIEEQVNGVDGMIYMSSSSSSSGQYTLTVTFEVGTDIDMATVLVQNRVNIAQPNLPAAVIQQGVVTRKQSTNIVLFLALTSESPLYDGLYLSNYAKLNITDELSRLPGVGSVTVFGADNYSMRRCVSGDTVAESGSVGGECGRSSYRFERSVSVYADFAGAAYDARRVRRNHYQGFAGERLSAFAGYCRIGSGQCYL